MNIAQRVFITSVAVLTVCLPGCKKGNGVIRVAADAENHDFLLDLPGKRVIYIAGTYPRKTYLSSQALDGGRKRSFRLPGYSLSGRPFLLRDGRTILATAKHFDDEYSHGVYSEVLLRVDLETGEILRAYELPLGAIVRAFAEPRWSPSPVIAIQGRGFSKLARLDSRTDLKTGGVQFSAELAGEVAIDEQYPTIAAVASTPLGAGVLRLFDAVSGMRGREVGLESPRLLEARGHGQWLVTVEDSNGGGAAVHFNDTLQTVSPLLSTPGRIESIVLGKRWLYAVALSPQVRSTATKSWIKPRQLHRIDLTDGEPPRTFPWTKRTGALLGLSENEEILYFAVTDNDNAALWSIPTDIGVLEGIGAQIDRSSHFSASLLYLLVFGALAVVFVIVLVNLLTSNPGI